MNFNGFEITPQSGEAGANKISISVPAVNESIDKVVEIDAINGDKSSRLTLIHEGLRQRYISADGKVLCTSDGGRYGVLKKKQKIVNQLRLAIVEAFFGLGKFVNADNLGGPVSWDYPVASDVNVFVTQESEGDVEEAALYLFPAGEKEYSDTKYVGNFISYRCEPAEDEIFIYEVIITDLR